MNITEIKEKVSHIEYKTIWLDMLQDDGEKRYMRLSADSKNVTFYDCKTRQRLPVEILDYRVENLELHITIKVGKND